MGNYPITGAGHDALFDNVAPPAGTRTFDATQSASLALINAGLAAMKTATDSRVQPVDVPQRDEGLLP